MNITNDLWVERYRPKSIGDLVLPDEYRQNFEICIKRNEIPNLLFYGPPGGGKSTMARILTSKEGVIQNPSDNVMEINGSAKETRGIGFVDSTIEPYLKVPPSGNDKYKIIFIDECDYLTDAAMSSLRAIIEKYSKYGRFLFTCNIVSKVTEALMSRVQAYEFKQLPLEFVEQYCNKILDSEKITYVSDSVKFVCSNLYPDVRRIVNCLQRNSLTGELKVNKDTVMTNEKLVISQILEIIAFTNDNQDAKVGTCIGNLIKVLGEYDIEYRGIYSNLFFRKEVPATCKVIINRYSNTHGDCLIPQMHFMAMVFEIVKILREYRAMTAARKV